MRLLPSFILIASLLLSGVALSAGLPPWEFGMTKDQVKSFSQFGPYKSFSNGDLETHNGIFRGQKENVQFFFQNNRLIRIGVYLGEGSDRDKVIATFRQVYDILRKDYGEVNIPEVEADAHSAPLTPDILAIGAAANAQATGYTHILPIKQPKNVRVSGVIMNNPEVDRNWFAVAIFFDPP